VCEADGRLFLGEIRTRASLAERIRREHVAGPARLVVCGGCSWRWSVRATDTSAAVLAVRSEVPASQAQDEPAVASRTVLPQPRDRRRSRDWVYVGD
jgi:hypothetical protein